MNIIMDIITATQAISQTLPILPQSVAPVGISDSDLQMARLLMESTTVGALVKCTIDFIEGAAKTKKPVPGKKPGLSKRSKYGLSFAMPVVWALVLKFSQNPAMLDAHGAVTSVLSYLMSQLIHQNTKPEKAPGANKKARSRSRVPAAEAPPQNEPVASK